VKEEKGMEEFLNWFVKLFFEMLDGVERNGFEDLNWKEVAEGGLNQLLVAVLNPPVGLFVNQVVEDFANGCLLLGIRFSVCLDLLNGDLLSSFLVRGFKLFPPPPNLKGEDPLLFQTLLELLLF
jgi:hypothetical protein